MAYAVPTYVGTGWDHWDHWRAMLMTAAATLSTLANRVSRLSPDRRDPEQWHLEKDDIAKALRRIAREIERERHD